MDKKLFYSLVRVTGKHELISDINEGFSDPADVLNLSYFAPMPDSVAKADWEKLGRYWQKCNWGFEGYPVLVSKYIRSYPVDGDAAVVEFRLATVNGQPTRFFEHVAHKYPGLVIQLVWCAADAEVFEANGCSFVDGTNDSYEAFAKSAESLDTLSNRFKFMWESQETYFELKGDPTTEFVPLANDDNEFAKLERHLKRAIAETFSISPEALTKETTSAVYQTAINLALNDNAFRKFVAEATSADKGADGGDNGANVQGADHEAPGSGPSAHTAPYGSGGSAPR